MRRQMRGDAGEGGVFVKQEPHGLLGQTVAAAVDEEEGRGSELVGISGFVAFQRGQDGVVAELDEAFLRTFAEDAHTLLREVDVGLTQRAELRDADAGGE